MLVPMFLGAGAACFLFGMWLGISDARPWWGRYFFVKTPWDFKLRDLYLVVNKETGEILYRSASPLKIEFLLDKELIGHMGTNDFTYYHAVLCVMSRRKYIRAFSATVQ